MAPLPAGTVTFLFTDIAGSTLLWQQQPDAMPAALARHHAILNGAIAAHGGHVFQIVGDAFCAAFSTPLGATNAGLAAQHALRDEAWGATGPIRVRMAVHTGTAQFQAGDRTSGEYRSGITLSRAARLLSAAHGGQLLLSQTAYELLLDQLPDDIALRDLGQHRLKDLARPEHVYQAVAPGLPSDFPPLNSLNPERHNLPIQLTSFIGRERDLATVKRLIGTTRLLTLTGVGGSGKTRLALQVAADVVDQSTEGVWLVELAALGDPALVPRAVAGVFGLHDQTGRSPLEALLEYLRPKAVLLILDNCEHLIGACAQLVDAVLRACPQVQVLATSREGLGVAGEVTWNVPSLIVPDVRQVLDLEIVSNSEAVRLFVQRAQAARPNLGLTGQNAATVARICQRLDGIPLAIELAAARAKALSVEQISTRLDDRFRLLTGGSRTALERQQTMRATLDWSYQLLSRRERTLLQRLSVFSGGWTLEAAEQICSGAGLDASDVLDLLARLVTKSLVVMDNEEIDEARYRLLETVGQYAREKLLQRGEVEGLRNRHLVFFLELAEEIEPKLKTSERLRRLRQLRNEYGNFRAALEWSLAEPDAIRAVLGLRLATALGGFWTHYGYATEGRGWLEKGLAALEADAGTARLRARALCAAGWLYYAQGDIDLANAMAAKSIALYRTIETIDPRDLADALSLFSWTSTGPAAQLATDESVRICRALGPSGAWHLAAVLFLEGHDAWANGDEATARACAEESRALFRSTGDIWQSALPTRLWGHIAFRQGDHAAARAFYKESLRLSQELGDLAMIARVLGWLADIDRWLGDYEAASANSQESLKLWRDIGHKSAIARHLRNLGIAALHQGNYERARQLLVESLGPWREDIVNAFAAGSLPDWEGYFTLALTLAGFAVIAVERGQWVRAARLLRIVESYAQKAGLLLASDRVFQPTDLVADRIDIERLTSAVRNRLPGAAWPPAGSDGEEMSWEQALDLASEDA